MLTLFGGRIDDLTPMLTEERFSDNWEPRVRSRFGLTMFKFNIGHVIPVERGVDTKKIEKERAEAEAAATTKTVGTVETVDAK